MTMTDENFLAEWIEVLEPRSQKSMVVSYKTGQILLQPPDGEQARKVDNKVWWEFYDIITNSFYYYNAVSRQTLWEKPSNVDIIPLTVVQEFVQRRAVNKSQSSNNETEGTPSNNAEIPENNQINGNNDIDTNESTAADTVETTSATRDHNNNNIDSNAIPSTDRSTETTNSSVAPDVTDSAPTPARQDQNMSSPDSTSTVTSVSTNSIVNPVTNPAPKSPKHYQIERLENYKKGSPNLTEYAKTYCAKHSKGVFIFKKKISIADLLSWSKELIKKPLLMTTDKKFKKESIEFFKSIQIYMGDRPNRPFIEPDKIALDLCTKGWRSKGIRDEIFLQLCKQTKRNNNVDSLIKGWELFAIFLEMFPPSTKFHSYLDGYFQTNTGETIGNNKISVAEYAVYCVRRLQRSKASPKKGNNDPSLQEVIHVKNTVIEKSQFGSTVTEVMEVQKKRYPERKIPWILSTLAEIVLRMGLTTEGIFRVPGDSDAVNALKVHMDQWNKPTSALLPDCHVPASLLKLWFRELWEPLIPERFYNTCIEHCREREQVINVVESLPDDNRRTLTYLIRFLQVFANQNKNTKMDLNNLAMVWAPNCLRCPSDDLKVIFTNTQKEMEFLRTLMLNLDTESVNGMV